MKEVKVNVRSVWTYTFLLLLFVFVIPILFLHGDHILGIGYYSSLTGTIMNLLLYFIPLMTLMISSFSLTMEKEDGSLPYLFTYPIKTKTWLVGKFVGILIVLCVIIGLCFSLLGLLSVFIGTQLPFTIYRFLLLFSIVLAIVFASIGTFLGVLSKNRWQSLIMSVSLWIIFVLAWPILFMAFLSSLHYSVVTLVLQIATIVNPAEFIRVFFTIKLGGGSIFGPEYYRWVNWVNGTEGNVVFGVVLLLGMIGSLVISNVIVKRGGES